MRTYERAYTDEELIADAKRFQHRNAWKEDGRQAMLAGRVSAHGCARKKGIAFMRLCCAHMDRSPKTQPVKWTDEYIVEMARSCSGKKDFKNKHKNLYEAWLARPHLRQVLNALLPPVANPYAGDYIIYVYEFTDRHAYIGLTFLREARRAQHLQRGPVARHLKVCPTYAYKHVAEDILTPKDAAEAEKQWILRYQAEGWTLLNIHPGGGVGSALVEWTDNAILDEARKFATKQAWIDGSQFTYRLAKRRGIYDACVTHMPKRDARHLVGRKVGEETRAKQRARKVGGKLTEQHRCKIGESGKLAWRKRRTCANGTGAA